MGAACVVWEGGTAVVLHALDEFNIFFRQEYGQLISFLLKSGFGRTDAEDAASVTMTLAYQNWGSLTSPRAWIRRVAYRHAMREAKRDRQQLSKLIEKGWIAVVDDGTEPFNEFETRSIVPGLLKLLPDQQRLVLALHLDGFSNVEIAAELGLLSSTVRSHLRYALMRLREAVRERGDALR